MSGITRKIFGSAPKVSSDAASDTADNATQAKAARVQLLETEGGIAGEELNPNEISKRRNTLLGN